jgi:hypothetical protein
MFLTSELNRDSEQTTAAPLLTYTLSYLWDEKRVILGNEVVGSGSERCVSEDCVGQGQVRVCFLIFEIIETRVREVVMDLP